MRATFDYDVLIAGAGPAGAHTALRLARAGWRVGLLDMRRFPRKKACGEFLSPACIPMLEELGLLDQLLTNGARRVSGMQLYAPKTSAIGHFVTIGPYRPATQAARGFGLGIRREVLDEQAVRAAEREPGITCLLGWRVRYAVTDAGGRVIGLSVSNPDGKRALLSARSVVAADGPRSRIANSLAWSSRWRGQERFALIARFHGVAPTTEAHVQILEGGDYFAACPIDSGIFTANLVVDREALSGGTRSLDALFAERLNAAPALQAKLAYAELVEPITVCGPLRTSTRRVSGPGIALVGDACGFVDPFTGEGMFFAMRGAAILAEEVDAALRGKRSEGAALRRYEQARRREFGPRYGLAKLLQSALRRRGVADRVVGWLGRWPRLCDLALGLTGDYVPPMGLLSPLLWRSVFGTGTQASPVKSPTDAHPLGR